MPIFAIETEDTTEAMNFFAQTAVRLNGDNFLKNPFTGTINRAGGVYILNLKGIYPNIAPYFVLLSIGLYILFGWHWWLIPPLILSSSWFFWTKWFFYPILKKGLKKSGYKGTIQLINNEKALERVLELWGNGRL